MGKQVEAVTGREATVTVSTTMFNQETEERRHIEIRPFATVPAKVTVKLGRTISLGNYEFAKIDVGIEMPAYREEVREVYEQLFPMVADLLSAEVNKVQGRMTGKAAVGIEEIV